MYPRWTAVLALVTLALGLVGCGGGPAKPKRGARVERLPRLEVVQPVSKRLIRKLDLAATVEAMKKVDLSARVPGVVSFLPDSMDIGRLVAKNEVLLKLAVPDLDADLTLKQAALEQAKQMAKLATATRIVAEKEVEETKKEDKRFRAEVDFSRSKYARISKLVKENAQDLMTQDEAYKQLLAAMAALESNVARTQKREARVKAAQEEEVVAAKKIEAAQAEVDKLKALISFAEIKAPFNGVITKRWVDPGATITGPTVNLLTVMQIDQVRVLVDVPQRDVPSLNDKEQAPNKDGEGDHVVMRFPNLVATVPRGEFEGAVTRVARSLDPVTRTMRAEIVVPNKKLKTGRYALQPGMYGTATVVIEDRSNVLALPASALVRRGEGNVAVYQVDDITGTGEDRRGVLKSVPVVLGIDDGKEVEIREGLKGGEWVVLRATGVLRDGEKVLALPVREAER